MGSEYKWDINPFRDYLLTMMMVMEIDISDKNVKKEIEASFIYILENILMNENDAVHLDFEIMNIDNHFKVFGNNAVTALWLCGIFPLDTELALKGNVFILKNRKYVFNEQTKELTYTILHE